MVVAVGFTLVEPLAEVEVNPPGEIEIAVAPPVVQLSVQLAPEFMLVGFAVKEAIEGDDPVSWGDELVVPAQLVRPTQASRMRPSALRPRPEGRRT